MTNGMQKPTHTKHYQKVMVQYDAKLGLSKEEFFGFALVSGMLARSLQPDEAEKQIAANFISHTICDPEFNSRVNRAINSILDQHAEEDPLYDTAMQMLEIIFNTRWLFHLKTILERMTTNREIVISGGSLQENQKLTLAEYALVRDVGALKPVIDKLDQIQSIDTVGELQQGITKCNQVIRDIELKIKIDQTKQTFFPIQKQNLFYEKLLNYFAHLSAVFVQSKLTPPPQRDMQP